MKSANTSNQPFVIIIPTFKQETLLKRTLESLSSCEFPNCSFKVIVVENGPKGNVETIIKKGNFVFETQYVYEKVANKSNALNKILNGLHDVFVILFDDDIRLDKNILTTYTLAFEKYGPGHFWGGRVAPDFAEGNPPDYLFDFFPASVKGFNLGKEIVKIKKPDFLGCNWAFYSEDLKQIGGFDPLFGPGSSMGVVGQETAAMDSLLKAGKKALYLPKAKVWHYVPKERADFKWLKQRKYKIGVRAGILEKKNIKSYNTIFGLPFWFYRFFFVSFFNAKLKIIFTHDKKKKALYILEYSQNLGMVKGLLQQKALKD